MGMEQDKKIERDGKMDQDEKMGKGNKPEGRADNIGGLNGEGDVPSLGGTGRAVATILSVSCLIVVLAAAAAWFLFFNAGDNADESRMYENIKRYESEQMLDSLKEGLGEYLDTYNSDAFHYSEVKSLRDRLMAEETDWMDTEKDMTVEGLEAFLSMHPDGFFSARANSCMDSLRALEEEEVKPLPVETHAADSVAGDSVVEAIELEEKKIEEKAAEKPESHGHHQTEVEVDSIFG